MKVQERIKVAREQKGFSQTQVAEAIGIAYQNYWKIENGKTELSVSRLNQIADVLEVSLGELLGIDSSNSRDTDRIKELEIALLDKDKQMKAIVDLAETLKELSDLKEKDLNRQIENLTWAQHKHQIAFGLAVEEIESAYGVDLIEYDTKDPETIQREVWFQPVIEKYRILLITVISTNLLNQVNQTLLKCFLDAMQPLTYGESMLFDRFDRIALLDKSIKDLYAHSSPGISDPLVEQNTPRK